MIELCIALKSQCFVSIIHITKIPFHPSTSVEINNPGHRGRTPGTRDVRQREQCPSSSCGRTPSLSERPAAPRPQFLAAWPRMPVGWGAMPGWWPALREGILYCWTCRRDGQHSLQKDTNIALCLTDFLKYTTLHGRPMSKWLKLGRWHTSYRLDVGSE